MNKPLVTVHMCTYDRADFISKALESVQSQTYDNLEILVLDDNSSDNTAEIVRNYSQSDSRIKYHKNESNVGITTNRNRALSLSNGKYIAVLDSDDYWIDENKIEDQVKFLESNPDFAVIGSYAKFVNEKDEEVFTYKPETKHDAIIKKILIKNQLVHSSVLIREEAFEKYPQQFSIWEDYALWLEIGKKWKIANLPITTTAHKKHSSNISKTKKLKNTKTLDQIIKNYKKDYPNYYLATFKNKLRILKSLIS
jgi:glycosyltransferase involved in cell wall biosynthesis